MSANHKAFNSMEYWLLDMRVLECSLQRKTGSPFRAHIILITYRQIVTFFLFTYFNFLSQKKICLGKEVFYPTKRFFLNSENIVHQQRTGKTSMIRTEWKFGSKSPLQRKHKDRKMGLKSTWLRLVVWSNPHCISDCIKTSIKTRPLDRKFAI